MIREGLGVGRGASNRNSLCFTRLLDLNGAFRTVLLPICPTLPEVEFSPPGEQNTRSQPESCTDFLGKALI